MKADQLHPSGWLAKNRRYTQNPAPRAKGLPWEVNE